ncbi:MAG: kynureninase [Pseudohongiella sp.]|nr:kynureninase [Pseudohongiella sp.]
MNPVTLTDVQALDLADPLARKRAEFDLPEHIIYLDGNSLGCLPSAVRTRVTEVIDQQWGTDLIKSWNTHGWIDLPVVTGEKIARLIGAAPGQVICCDSISVNLFKLLSAALGLQPGRTVVLSQDDNFPTDLYMVQGLSDLLGSHRCRLLTVCAEDLERQLSSDVAVLMLTHVNFRSGYIHDMQRITELAHSKGILVIWDLAHSAGVLPLQLDQCQVDFAVGCTYKYLNAGPGAPAFLYVAKRHLSHVNQALCGWMGHQSPFQFSSEYEGAPGIEKFLTGTPPVISMSALDAALDVFDKVDLLEVRHKTKRLTDLFITLAAQTPALDVLSLASPTDADQRGAQLAWRHANAYAICQALIAEGVIGDFRAPDILRLGFSPLYLRYEDVWHSVKVLATIMETGRWQNKKFSQTSKVT